jgi:hypothetical protein
MKPPNLFLKVTAVTSSVLLAGVFISYHAGAFDGLLNTSERSGESRKSQTLEHKQSDSPQSEKVSAEPASSHRQPGAGGKSTPSARPRSKSFAMTDPSNSGGSTRRPMAPAQKPPAVSAKRHLQLLVQVLEYFASSQKKSSAPPKRRRILMSGPKAGIGGRRPGPDPDVSDRE